MPPDDDDDDVHCFVPEPASSVIPTLARTRDLDALKPGSSGLSEDTCSVPARDILVSECVLISPHISTSCRARDLNPGPLWPTELLRQAIVTNMMNKFGCCCLFNV